MTARTMDEVKLCINQLVGNQELLREALKKATVLLDTILADENRKLLPSSNSYHIVWIVDDLVERAFKLGEEVLDELLRLENDNFFDGAFHTCT